MTYKGYVPERDYIANKWQPFGKPFKDLCGGCLSYYKNLYDRKLIDSPFPPHCNKHVLDPLKNLTPADFNSKEEYEIVKVQMDPVSWALSEFGWEARWYQEEFLSCSSNKILLRMGRRIGKCLEEGTLVSTPTGPRAIESLAPGDIVYDENGKTIKVKELFDQGIKDVVDLTIRDKVIVSCTLDHLWLMKNGSGSIEVRPTKDIKKNYSIARTEIEAPLGHINNPTAYTLGALLGDGCSREGGLVISTGDEEIVAKIATQLGTTYRKNGGNNYSWYLSSSNRQKIAYYLDWCQGRYAHDKITNLDIIKQWDRNSLLEFVAGLIDTDGSIFSPRGKEIVINLGMQAKSVIEAAKYAFLALWQVDLSIHVDNRPKYKNGPVFFISIKNIAQCKRILKELDNHLVVPRKKYKQEYDLLEPNNFNPNWVGIKVSNTRKARCYDIHVDSETNLYLLANGLITHNSEGMVVKALHTAYTNTNHTVLWIAPYMSQVQEAFDKMHKLLNASVNVRKSVSRSLMGSPMRLEFFNGSKILGLGSSATSSSSSEKIRGLDSHLIVLDEFDSLADNDVDAILAIMASHKDTKVIIASTPRGWRKKFFNFSTDKNLGFKEFHVISAEGPDWTVDTESFLRKQASSEASFKQEYLADWAESEAGVFKKIHLDNSVEHYDLAAISPIGGATYMMGVDWNKSAGTHIVIVQWTSGKLRLVRKVIIPESEYSQTEGVNTIIHLNAVWAPKIIALDLGYGFTQFELLKKYGLNNPTSGLHEKLLGIQMQQSLEVRDPVTGFLEKKPAKPYLVNTTAKALEDGLLTLPASEDTMVQSGNPTMGLIQQMRNYIVEDYSQLGRPRYSAEDDHTLTAYILAIGGYIYKFGELTRLNLATGGGVSSTKESQSVLGRSGSPLAPKPFSRALPNSSPSGRKIIGVHDNPDFNKPKSPFKRRSF